jgi:hypothetical protein
VDTPSRNHSIFYGTLRGYAVGAAFGTLVTIVVSAVTGTASAKAGYWLLLATGGLGAVDGYQATVKRRATLGTKEPQNAWSKFAASVTRFALMCIVVGGSLGIAILLALVMHFLLNY